jgi:hypothetical protein
VTTLALVTRAIALQFEGALCAEFGVLVVEKSSGFAAPVARTLAVGFDVAKLLGVAGLPSSKEWAKFGLSLGPVIFLDDAEDSDAAQRQRCIMLTHEAEHAGVQWPGAKTAMPWFYLTDRVERVTYEANAYGAGFALDYALGGEAPPVIEDVAPALARAYHLRDEDIRHGHGMLKAHVLMAQAMSHNTRAATWAIGWFRTHHPECLRPEFRTI